jgi:hypothetical protein
MKIKSFIKIIFMIMLISFTPAFAKKDIKIFNSIEFRNINYLSKYEIIDSANIGTRGKALLVDMNLLEKILNDMPLVKSFRIIENSQRLIIDIVEKRPAFLLSVRDGGKNTIVELNNEYHIISANRAHLLDLPLIIIPQEDVKGGKNFTRLKMMLETIYALQIKSLPVMKEIIEIDFLDGLRIEVMLKSRRTVFSIKPDIDGFKKLNYAAGYFDRIKYYPNTFTILNGLGILDRNS